MDPGTYISVVGATYKAIQICGVLKKALQGHKESKQTLDELKHIVVTVKRTLDENAAEVPTLHDIVKDLEEFHHEYQSAGRPGVRLDQVSNRIRLGFSEDGLNKKYDRLMLHMTCEIYAYVFFPCPLFLEISPLAMRCADWINHVLHVVGSSNPARRLPQALNPSASESTTMARPRAHTQAFLEPRFSPRVLHR